MTVPSRSDNSLPVRERRRSPFIPSLRGDLTEALVSAEAFAAIAPQAPRPLPYLLDAILVGDDEVTARDMALFELLVTLALEEDPSLATLTETRSRPVRQALAFMSVGGWQAKPRELSASLRRMFRGEPQVLSTKGEFRYALPSWIGPHLRSGERYGYLELTAMARFRTKGTSTLYRRIVGHLAANRIRYVPGAAPIRIELTPQELGLMMGFPGRVHVGRLRAAYVTPALAEILEHVEAFEVDVEDTHKGAGRAIEKMTLVIWMKPPARLETVAARSIDKADFAFMHERPDAPRFRVDPATLVRLGSVLPSRVHAQRRKGAKANPLLASEMGDWHRAWLVALREALTGEAVTDMAGRRNFRGLQLLEAIDRLGGDNAFFAWAMEEADAPDLMPALVDCFALIRAADADRKARWKQHVAQRGMKSRVALRLDRQDGIVAPAKPRMATARKAVSVPAAPSIVEAPPTIEAAPEPAMSFHGDVALSDDERARAMLLTPAAKAEADRLWQDTGLAFDFPHTHAATTLGRILQRFAEDYPTIAEADALVDRLYTRGLWRLSTLTKERIPTDDEFAHYIALLARTFLVQIRNGKVGPVKVGLEQTKEIYARDISAAYARRAEAAKRNAGRYVRGQAASATESRDLRQAPIFDADEMAEISTYAIAVPRAERDPSTLPPTTPSKAPTGFRRVPPTEG